MKKQLKVLKFKNEDQERKFWSKAQLSRYFVASNFERASFPNLKPTLLNKFTGLGEEKYLGRLMRLTEKERNIPIAKAKKLFQ